MTIQRDWFEKIERLTAILGDINANVSGDAAAVGFVVCGGDGGVAVGGGGGVLWLCAGDVD